MLQLSHKKLEVYQLSLNLVKKIYEITKKFPKEERYVLVSQLQRAGISVSSNISEGAARISKNEKKRFYEIARSSVVEVDTQIEISIMLNYCQKNELPELEENIEAIFRKLSKMISNLTI